MTLYDRLQEYQDIVQQVDGLIVSAHRSDNTGNPLWLLAETRLITESAFLKFFIAWESFLEGAMTDYMLGEQSISGRAIQRYVFPQNVSHANEMIIGVQRYFDYTDPDKVTKLSGIFLKDGEPFETGIKAIHSHLRDLKTIRNAAAHLSSSTSKQLDAVAQKLLNQPCRNITVYDLILSTDPASSASDTIFNMFKLQLGTAAYTIAFA